jgi:D-alanyl-D-alanine carboxypeptidase
LLDWGFKNVKERQLTEAGTIVGEVAVAANSGVTVPVRVDKTISKKVFRLDGKVRSKVHLTAPVALPVFEGQPLGEVKVVQRDRVLARMPAIAAATTVSTEGTVGAVPVTDYLDRTVSARTVAVDAAEPKFDPNSPVSQRVEIEPKVTAPVLKGDRLGAITYVQAGEVVARVPVVAGESIEPPGFIDNLRIALARSWRGLTGGQPMARLQIVSS